MTNLRAKYWWKAGLVGMAIWGVTFFLAMTGVLPRMANNALAIMHLPSIFVAFAQLGATSNFEKYCIWAATWFTSLGTGFIVGSLVGLIYGAYTSYRDPGPKNSSANRGPQQLQ